MNNLLLYSHPAELTDFTLPQIYQARRLCPVPYLQRGETGRTSPSLHFLLQVLDSTKSTSKFQKQHSLRCPTLSRVSHANLDQMLTSAGKGSIAQVPVPAPRSLCSLLFHLTNASPSSCATLHSPVSCGSRGRNSQPDKGQAIPWYLALWYF